MKNGHDTGQGQPVAGQILQSVNIAKFGSLRAGVGGGSTRAGGLGLNLPDPTVPAG
jgi:hypothetical protein